MRVTLRHVSGCSHPHLSHGTRLSPTQGTTHRDIRAAATDTPPPRAPHQHARLRNNIVPFLRRRTLPAAPVSTAPLLPPPGTPDFRVGLQNAPVEYITPTPCAITGTLPKEVRGTLYRNGPAQFDVHGERVKHWFDGDGKVIAVRLDEAGATYQSRFVDTVARQKERRRGKRLYGGLGDLPRGRLLGTLRGYLGKNVANTNVVAFADKLWAMYEGGRPYQLHPQTLATVQEDDLGGVLTGSQAASAHPKLHTATNTLWNFKIQYGQKNTVQLYRTDAAGQSTDHTTFELPYTTMVHDFCLTQTQAVFVLSPLVVPLKELALYVLGIKPMHALPRLDPNAGSYIVTVPLTRDNPTARIARFDTPVMILHTVNAWDDNGDVVIDTCDFSAAHSLDLPTAMMGDAPLARSMPKFRRLRLDTQNHVHTEFLGDAQLEFPQVAPHAMHKAHTKIYGVQWPEDKAYVGVPACYDIATDTVVQAPMQAGCYASECILVPKEDAQREDQVYLLTVVLDSRHQSSALHVYDGENLQQGAVARVDLPQVVPHSFHGSWVAQKNRERHHAGPRPG